MKTKPALTSQALHPIIQNRWSPRAFDTNQAIDQSSLTALLEAAQWAPSCMNEQPWRFIVCLKDQHPQAWARLLACIAEKNQPWAANAPLLIAAIAINHFNHNQQPNRWAAYDTGAACLNLSLQATALGLVCHQMGGFDQAKLAQDFDLPKDCTPMTVIAVGYQAEADCLNAEFQQRELADRSRAALEQRFYFGRWQPDQSN